MAASSGQKFGDAFNEKLSSLHKMAVERDAQADGVLAPGSGANPMFTDGEIDAALGEVVAQKNR